jgi:hypothetical protein
VTSPEQAPDPEGKRIVSIDTLSEKVDKIIERLAEITGSGKQPPKEDKPEGQAPETQTTAQRTGSIRTEMQEAIDEHERQKKTDDLLTQLSGKVAAHDAVFEKPPRQFRKVEHAMGWPDKED